MPAGDRRWRDYWVPKYLKEHPRASEAWKRNTKRRLNHLVYVGHFGRSRTKTRQPVFVRAGVSELPLSPTDVTDDQINKVRDYVMVAYTPQSGRAVMGEFRRLLRCAGNRWAEVDELWEMPDGEAMRRRWLEARQLVELLQTAKTDRERVVIALLGLCALRGIEVTRMLVRDVTLDGPEPCIRVLGKGKNGGRWRTVPLMGLASEYIRPWVVGREKAERLVPFKLVTIQKDVSSTGKRANPPIPVSAHDLRRTFGRLFVEANHYDVRCLVALQKWYGHKKLETTIHYLGFDFEEMRRGAARFDAMLRSMLRPTEVGTELLAAQELA
jgi:integrase